jgi:hypothetical protein
VCLRANLRSDRQRVRFRWLWRDVWVVQRITTLH